MNEKKVVLWRDFLADQKRWIAKIGLAHRDIKNRLSPHQIRPINPELAIIHDAVFSLGIMIDGVTEAMERMSNPENVKKDDQCPSK